MDLAYGGTTMVDSAARTVFTRMRRHLPPYLAMTGKLAGRGAVESSADGCRVRLSDGRSALDFGSYAVTLLGHRHPAVVAAVRAQLDAQPVATRTLANPATAAAAARLVEYLDSELTRVCFGVSGADAVEAAIKLARLASGRSRIVAVQGGFHGKSLGALALTHHERYRTGLLDVLPGVAHVPADDPDAVAREIGRGDVAALIFEPVQGENGVRPLEPDVLAAWCSAATANDAFVIADEIQCGLRRCGEPSLALAAGLPVDAVLMGKPLGGGVLPVSAAVCRDRLYAPLLADPVVHTSTFAGYPLGCAAVPAALDAIEELADRGPVLATAMADGLAELRRRYPGTVAEVRGRGLLWGMDLDPPHLAGDLVVQLAQAGLLVSPCMSRPGTLRLMPPLVAGAAEVSEALDIVAVVLDRAASGVRAAGVPSSAPTAP